MSNTIEEIEDVDFAWILEDLEKVVSREIISRKTDIKRCTVKNMALGLHDPKWKSGRRLYNYAAKILGIEQMVKYKK